MDRDCENCARCARNGCTSWDCDFIPRKEAIRAYLEKRDLERRHKENNNETE